MWPKSWIAKSNAVCSAGSLQLPNSNLTKFAFHLSFKCWCARNKRKNMMSTSHLHRALWVSCCCLVAKSCPTLFWPHGLLPARLLCPWDFPGKNTGVGCHFLLQGIFPTQGLNPGLPPHYRQILYLLSYQRSLGFLSSVNNIPNDKRSGTKKGSV